MLQSKMIGKTQKEWPSEASLKSHGVLVKGGYIKQVAGGTYTLLPLAKSVSMKIENIIRDEMYNLGAQEIFMPILISNEDIQKISCDEEMAIYNVLSDATSYQKYPFTIYNMQTKCKDVAKNKTGLINTKQYTLNQAYSFYTSQESLNENYEKFCKAYERIYRKIGIDNIIAVKSNIGLPTEKCEFMLLCEFGEDKVVVCSECDYKSNVELAEVIGIKPATAKIEEMNKIHTPGVKTIEGLYEFTKVPVEHMAKAVIYTRLDNDKTVIVFIRADREVNEIKLKSYLGTNIAPKVASKKDEIAYGSVGPVGLDLDVVEVIYDKSLENEVWLLAGANEVDYHISGINIKRDVGAVDYIDVAKLSENDICPICNKSNIKVLNGVKLGCVSKLDKQYTGKMKMTYLNEIGKEENPLMISCKIGIERLIASVLEKNSTESTTNWPASISPFDVHICPIGYPNKEAVKEVADKLYIDLKEEGFEVLLDDRNKNSGVKFADADLIGTPIRLVIGMKNLENNEIEIKIGEEVKLVKVENIINFVREENKKLIEKYK